MPQLPMDPRSVPAPDAEPPQEKKGKVSIFTFSSWRQSPPSEEHPF